VAPTFRASGLDLIWQDRSSQPPGEPPITGQYPWRRTLPVTFSLCEVSKVGLTLESRTFGAMNPREHGFFRLSSWFSSIIHMGPSERISSTRLLNEDISFLKVSTSLPLLRFTMKRVKDLGLEFWSHDKKGSGRCILFRRMVSGRHDISYLNHLKKLCPRETSLVKLGIRPISWKCKFTRP
jgi:hypothetical protein